MILLTITRLQHAVRVIWRLWLTAPMADCHRVLTPVQIDKPEEDNLCTPSLTTRPCDSAGPHCETVQLFSSDSFDYRTL